MCLSHLFFPELRWEVAEGMKEFFYLLVLGNGTVKREPGGKIWNFPQTSPILSEFQILKEWDLRGSWDCSS